MAIAVREMTDEEFLAFRQWSVAQNARELAEESQLDYKQAIREATEEIARMLPNGMRTEHNYLMTITEEPSKEIAGFIWTLHEETAGCKQSFLCDFVVLESKRRKGIATEALGRMEAAAREAGCRESVLFVSDRNHAAKSLYEKCGYQYLRQQDYGKYMIKQLV